ncbi:nucleotidyltransferase domain-containing protein [Candidatus Neomarinimicrobiota bacterium]
MEKNEYDLAVIADNLASEFPAIEALYLFGSRRFRTNSIRSDVDILVVCSDRLKPSDLRAFSQAHCQALDFFIVENGRAISTQNESFIEAESFDDLIKTLQAICF